MPSPTPVTINLNVSVEASGNITVFGAQQDSVSNVIIADYKLPVDCLYKSDTSGGLIEFWEPSDSLGTIKCKLADGTSAGHNYADFYKQTAKKLAKGLQRTLCDSFDCSNAIPYKDNSKYNSDYYNVSDFGRVALNLYAHYLFGHVAATSAITNDVSFMSKMLSISESIVSDLSGTALSRYNAWTEVSNISSWDSTTTGDTTADIARKLVSALIKKGLDTNGNLVTSDISNSSSGSSAPLAQIVKQVLGQDATRAMGQDNNELAPNTHQLLRFYDGDVIYVSITLQQPLVTVNGKTTVNADGQLAYTDSTSIGGNTYTETTYSIKITLDGNKSADNIGTNADLKDAPEYFTYLDPVTSVNTLNALNSVTDSTNTSAINTVFSQLNTNTNYELSKGSIIDAIFSKLGTSSFTVSSSALNPSLVGATSIPSNVSVYQPRMSASPLDVSTLDSNNGLYVNLYNVGTSTYFSYNGSQIVITKTSDTLYTVTDNSTVPATISTRTKGDVIKIGDIGYMFGSVLAFNSKYDVKVLNDDKNTSIADFVLDSNNNRRIVSNIYKNQLVMNGISVPVATSLLKYSEFSNPIEFSEDITSIPLDIDTDSMTYYQTNGVKSEIINMVIDVNDNIYFAVNYGEGRAVDSTNNLIKYKSKVSIFKYDSSQNLIFRKDFSNYRTSLFVMTLTVDEHQNIYLGGMANDDSFVPPGTFNTTKSTPTITGGFVLKCDSLCNPVWARWYNVKSTITNVNQNLTDMIRYIKVYGDRLYVSGLTRYPLEQIDQSFYQPETSRSFATFLIKLDTNGNTIFSKWIDGLSHDSPFTLVEDTNQNVYIVLGTKENVAISNNTNNGFIFSTNSSIFKNTGPSRPPTSTHYNRYVIVKFSSTGSVLLARYLDSPLKFTLSDIIFDNNYMYIKGVGYDKFTVSSNDVINNNLTKQSDVGSIYILKMNDTLDITWGTWIDYPFKFITTVNTYIQSYNRNNIVYFLPYTYLDGIVNFNINNYLLTYPL